MEEKSKFPCPVPPMPPRARHHCRHYSYSIESFREGGGGPQCAAGCDMSAPGSALPCMPLDSQRGATCSKREEWTDKERAEWEAWVDHHRARMLAVFSVLPDDSGGTIPCPACGTGTVSYARARSNGHLHAACSTPNCFAVMQ